MTAGMKGNGPYRYCFAGGYLDDSSRIIYDVYDNVGSAVSRMGRMDDFADTGMLKGLGGTGHLDDAEDILSAAKGLDDVKPPKGVDGPGGGLKVDDYVRVTEGGRQTATTIDYSYKFDRELANFNDGYEIRTTVDKDLILVQYSSDAPDASLCYWTTVDEANGITTLNDYMDKLALSKDWGNRNIVKVARIPSGTEVKYAVGTAREQLLIADPRPGGGVQYLFNQFDTDWITEIRSFSN